MNKTPKTKKIYFCKHCGKIISICSALYGQHQCKTCQNRKFFIDKSELYKEYILKHKSIIEIAQIFKCCYGTIFKWLLNYNIKIKSRRETHLGRKRPDHSKRMTGKGNPLFGVRRSKAVRDKISRGKIGKYKGRNNHNFGKKSSHKCSYGHGGRYKHTWFKSSYEIAYAKYLTKNHVKWQYEPKAFDLGNTTYRPDFYLPKSNIWIEVKGYWREEALHKFNLFKKLYPKIKIVVFDKLRLIKEGVDVC